MACATCGPCRPSANASFRAGYAGQADAGMDELLEDTIGRLFGDLLDLDAAVGTDHHHGPLGGAIEHETQVELPFDLRGPARRARAGRSARAARSGRSRGWTPIIFCAARCASSGDLTTFTPPPLPRPPAWIWALTTTVPPSRRAAAPGVFGREHDVSLRHGNAVAGQDGLRLILVNLHGVSVRPGARRRPRASS